MTRPDPGFSVASTLPSSGPGALHGIVKQVADRGHSWRNQAVLRLQPLTDDERAGLQAALVRLREEHRDLDTAIAALAETSHSDHLQMQRLKKRKLFLKDQITQLEDQLLPDIIA